MCGHMLHILLVAIALNGVCHADPPKRRLYRRKAYAEWLAQQTLAPYTQVTTTDTPLPTQAAVIEKVKLANENKQYRKVRRGDWQGRKQKQRRQNSVVPQRTITEVYGYDDEPDGTVTQVYTLGEASDPTITIQSYTPWPYSFLAATSSDLGPYTQRPFATAISTPVSSSSIGVAQSITPLPYQTSNGGTDEGPDPTGPTSSIQSAVIDGVTGTGTLYLYTPYPYISIITTTDYGGITKSEDYTTRITPNASSPTGTILTIVGADYVTSDFQIDDGAGQTPSTGTSIVPPSLGTPQGVGTVEHYTRASYLTSTSIVDGQGATSSPPATNVISAGTVLGQKGTVSITLYDSYVTQTFQVDDGADLPPSTSTSIVLATDGVDPGTGTVEIHTRASYNTASTFFIDGSGTISPPPVTNTVSAGTTLNHAGTISVTAYNSYVTSSFQVDDGAGLPASSSTSTIAPSDGTPIGVGSIEITTRASYNTVTSAIDGSGTISANPITQTAIPAGTTLGHSGVVTVTTYDPYVTQSFQVDDGAGLPASSTTNTIAPSNGNPVGTGSVQITTRASYITQSTLIDGNGTTSADPVTETITLAGTTLNHPGTLLVSSYYSYITQSFQVDDGAGQTPSSTTNIVAPSAGNPVGIGTIDVTTRASYVSNPASFIDGRGTTSGDPITNTISAGTVVNHAGTVAVTSYNPYVTQDYQVDDGAGLPPSSTTSTTYPIGYAGTGTVARYTRASYITATSFVDGRGLVSSTPTTATTSAGTTLNRLGTVSVTAYYPYITSTVQVDNGAGLTPSTSVSYVYATAALPSGTGTVITTTRASYLTITSYTDLQGSTIPINSATTTVSAGTVPGHSGTVSFTAAYPYIASISYTDLQNLATTASTVTIITAGTPGTVRMTGTISVLNPDTYAYLSKTTGSAFVQAVTTTAGAGIHSPQRTGTVSYTIPTGGATNSGSTYIYMGCANDPLQNLLPALSTSSTNGFAYCSSVCTKKYFGLYNTQCFCGDTFNGTPSVYAAGCTTACPSTTINEKCGTTASVFGGASSGVAVSLYVRKVG